MVGRPSVKSTSETSIAQPSFPVTQTPLRSQGARVAEIPLRRRAAASSSVARGPRPACRSASTSVSFCSSCGVQCGCLRNARCGSESGTRLKARGGASTQFEPPPLRVMSTRIAVAPRVRSSRARRSISAVRRFALARSIESAQVESQGALVSRRISRTTSSQTSGEECSLNSAIRRTPAVRRPSRKSPCGNGSAPSGVNPATWEKSTPGDDGRR